MQLFKKCDSFNRLTFAIFLSTIIFILFSILNKEVLAIKSRFTTWWKRYEIIGKDNANAHKFTNQLFYLGTYTHGW